MGIRDVLVSAAEIVEGDALTSAQLVAVVAWSDRSCCPLLRTNPLWVREEDRATVRGWALAVLSRGEQLALIRADQWPLE